MSTLPLSPAAPPPRAPRLVRLALLAFPLALVFCVLLYFNGEIGKTTDDWSSNRRDPVTGKAPDSLLGYFGHYRYFWRPVHLLILSGAATHVYHGVWGERAVGLFCVLAHVFASWQLYRFLRLCIAHPARGPAAVGALLFLMAPFHYEVVYWLSSASTALATGIFFLAARLCIERLHPGRVPIRFHVLLFLLVFLIPCLYEQPSAGVAALPLFLLAARASDGNVRAGPRTAALGRAAAFTITAALATVLYLALLVATAPPSARGGAGSLIDFGELAERTDSFANSLRFALLRRTPSTLLGGVDLGGDILASAGASALALAAVLTVLALAWVFAITIDRARAPGAPRASAPASIARRLTAPLLWTAGALVLIAASFIPVFAVRGQGVEIRNLYFPSTGLAIIIAQALRPVWSIASPRLATALCVTVAGAAAALVLFFSVAHVGQQGAIRRLHRADAAVIDRIVHALPNPPPDAAFFPLHDLRRPVKTPWPLFNTVRPTVLAAYWAGGSMLKHSYRRRDLSLIRCSPWAPTPFHAASEHGLHWIPVVRLSSHDFISWDRIVPFEIDPRGRVRFIRTLIVETPSGRRYEHTSPVIDQVRGPAAEHIVPRRLFTMSPAPGAEFLTGWTWANNDEPVRFRDRIVRRVQQPTDWMHAAPADAPLPAPRSEMRCTIPGSPLDRRIVFRASLTGTEEKRAGEHGGASLTVLSAATGEMLGAIRFSPRDTRTEWRSVVVPLPAGTSSDPFPIRLRFESPAGTPPDRLPSLWVTPGQVFVGLADEEIEVQGKDAHTPPPQDPRAHPVSRPS